MNIIKVVVGSAHGDEGKGLMTDYYASKNPDAIVVRHNGGAQAGHCQTGDTIIFSEHGLKYLKDVVGNETTDSKSLSLINMNNELEQTSLLFTEHDKSVNRICLSNGSELKATSAHSYYVWNSQIENFEWIKTIDLNPNFHQFIIPKTFPSYRGTYPKLKPVPSKVSLNSKIKVKYEEIHPEFVAFLVGLINGDGYFGDKHRISIQFNINQHDVVEYVKTNIERMGMNVAIKPHASSDNCITLSFGSSEFLHILEHQLGVNIATGAQKTTPTFVMQGTIEIIIHYIRGIMDADGTIKFHQQNQNLSGQIGFTNISYTLVKELQQLLYLCGIHSKIISDSVRRGCQPSWSLTISSVDSIKLYNERINFPSLYKKQRCTQLAEGKIQASKNVNATGYRVKIAPKSKQVIYKECHQSVHNSPTIRSGFVNSHSFKGFEHLKDVCKNYHVLDIIDVQLDYSVEQVYDVTMPKTHSYIANGVISHNTVTTPDGKRHVFSHFSSGTFAGNETYLSHHFVSNPMLFYKEHSQFVEQFGFAPKITVHPSSYVTTPYDMLLNQTMEKMRGDDPHGSCGTGFGETLERIKRNVAPLKIGPLKTFSSSSFRDDLEKIRSVYVPSRVDMSQVSRHFTDVVDDDKLIEYFFMCVEYMLDHVTLRSTQHCKNRDLIFESAQGLLLDQNYGYFPHVTRSNTGMQNVAEILSHFPSHDYDIEVNYVTRAYTTRHGAGPLDYEYDIDNVPLNIVDETNRPNEWQGSLRIAPLNWDLFESITTKDFALHAPTGAKKVTTITCLDQIQTEFECIKKGEITRMFSSFFKETIVPQIAEYRSYGPVRDDVWET